ncbi:MAG TPA: hypothetical protein PLJ12_15380, partial [Planctomycetota bacterium]|nr:hypothetical protein [Planctomycetota bacterium]
MIRFVQEALGEGRFELSQPAAGNQCIGQPLSCTLHVAHDSADALPESIPAPFPVGEDWVLLDGPVLRVHPRSGGGLESEVQWTYMPLQPGDHATGEYRLTLKRGAEVTIPSVTITVQSELTEQDQAPRPMAQALPAPKVDAGGWLWFALPTVLVVALAWVWWRRRKPPVEATASGPDALARSLQAKWDEAAGRELLFQWHRDLRAALDDRLGIDRASCTDE